jgi:hypothetical protein
VDAIGQISLSTLVSGPLLSVCKSVDVPRDTLCHATAFDLDTHKNAVKFKGFKITSRWKVIRDI